MRIYTYSPIVLSFLAACAAVSCGGDDAPAGSGGSGGTGGSAARAGKGGGAGKGGKGGSSGKSGDTGGNAGTSHAGKGSTSPMSDAGTGGDDGDSGTGNTPGSAGRGGDSGSEGHSDAGEAGAMARAGAGGEGSPGGDPAVCGDGAVTGHEACDDGDNDDADGCSASCEVEHVLDIGHIDLFSVVYDETTSSLALQTKEDSGLYRAHTAYWEPESVTIDVDPTRNALQLPDERFAFIGEVGTTVYILPEGGTEAAEWRVPWPGWESARLQNSLPEGVEPADTDYPLSLEIEVVEAPGGLFTFFSPQDELSPPTGLYLNSVDSEPDIIPMPTYSHTHTNWAFTAVGDYYLEATPSLVTKNHGTLTGPTRTFHFHVGDPLVPAVASPVLAVQSDPLPPYDAGDAVELTASFQPADAFARIEWYRPGQLDVNGDLQAERVAGHYGTTFSFTTTGTGDDGKNFPVLVNPATGRIYQQY